MVSASAGIKDYAVVSSLLGNDVERHSCSGFLGAPRRLGAPPALCVQSTAYNYVSYTYFLFSQATLLGPFSLMWKSRRLMEIRLARLGLLGGKSSTPRRAASGL